MKELCTKIAAVLVILVLVASIGCGIIKSDIEPLNVQIVDEDNPSFNITIEDFIEQFNMLYKEDHGSGYLTPSDDGCQSFFSEDDAMWVLPRLSLVTHENGYINMASFSFDWHSYTESLLEKYTIMCFYSFKIFLPELSDEDIENLCDSVIDDGYNNPVSRESEMPFAIYHYGNIGISTRFAIGRSQVISIIPVTEKIINDYRSKGVIINYIGD